MYKYIHPLAQGGDPRQLEEFSLSNDALQPVSDKNICHSIASYLSIFVPSFLVERATMHCNALQ